MGMDPLPRCDMCWMKILVGRIVRYLWTVRYAHNTQMRLRRWDVKIAAKCTGATFSLTGDNRAECFEGVDSFNYLRRVLHQSDEDWSEVRRNIRRARQVWGRLEKLLSMEGAEPIISKKF